jgi:hypothetical protein
VLGGKLPLLPADAHTNELAAINTEAAAVLDYLGRDPAQTEPDANEVADLEGLVVHGFLRARFFGGSGEAITSPHQAHVTSRNTGVGL